jgi:RHS repeat-associated protein
MQLLRPFLALLVALASASLAFAADAAPIGSPPGSWHCPLHPLAVPAKLVAHRDPGESLGELTVGGGANDLAFLSWAGSRDTATLVEDLELGGVEIGYQNPDDSADQRLHLGDWVLASDALPDDPAVRAAIEQLAHRDLIVPVWDEVRVRREGAAYRVAGYARIRLGIASQGNRNGALTVEWLAEGWCGTQDTSRSATTGGKFPWQEYEKHINDRSSLTTLGEDLFGDRVNLSNGALSFAVTDVSIPGNAMPMAMTRTFNVASRQDDHPNDLPMADWDLDVPRISGVFATTWPNQRCSVTTSSAATPPTVTTAGGATYHAWEYWQGIQAQMPGGGEMLLANRGTQMPTSGGPYYWLTSSFTYFSCLPTIKNGNGEGFVAITADGTEYRFDWMAQFYEAPLAAPVSGPSGAPLPRRKNVLYATQVKDRFGNTVTYNYSNAATAPVRLQSIVGKSVNASEPDRTLIFYYNPQGNVSTVSDGTRWWTYTYSYPGASRGTLTEVRLPDSSRWTINFKPLSDAQIEYQANPPGEPNPRSCDSPGVVISGEFVGTVTHPSGAVGEFQVSPRRHGRSKVPRACANIEYPINNPSNDVAFWPRNYDALSLTRKRIAGPAISPVEWTYIYSAAHSWYDPNENACQSETCGQPRCLSESCATARSTTIVMGPVIGEQTRYLFGNTYRYDEGKLRKVERRRNLLTNVRVTDTSFQLAQSGQPFKTPIGTHPHFRGDGFTSEYLMPERGSSVTQEVAVFSSTVNAFDSFARPTSVTRSGSATRTESVLYHDNLSRWVLGQVHRVTNTANGQVMRQSDYDPTTALPIREYSFGRLLHSLGYHSDGSLWTYTDGRNLTTRLTNWHRGVPRRIDFHDGTFRSAAVDNLGQVTSVTDEVANQTQYGYDAMGRLNRVTYPTGDSVAWAQRTAAFQQIQSPEHGIPAGHWRHTTTHGNYRKVVYLDGLWRPILTHEYDAANIAGTSRYNARLFDENSRDKLVAYPTSTAPVWTSSFSWSLSGQPPKGIRTGYDALGRVRTVEQDSELGVLTTRTDYEFGFVKRVTNPRGKATLYAFQTFDQPDEAAPRTILAPLGVQTTIERDPYGKPLSITREGSFNGSLVAATRRYVYDPQQRLCKRIDPESGATVFDYDGADNLLWSADGLTLPSTTSCDRPLVSTASRTIRSYDARNRVTFVNYPADTADIAYQYEPDGALRRIETRYPFVTIDWNYSYNKRRLLTSERTQWGEGMTFWHAYNALGHLSATTYPTDLTLLFAPNALGQPTQVRDQATWQAYASNTQYFPNGALKSFMYGNDISRTIEPNMRQLPQRLRDSWNGAVYQDFQYAYDANGNVTSITDVEPNTVSQTRELAYDDLDRLVVANATALWGNGSYVYDPLDNLRAANRGAVQYRYNYFSDGSNRLASLTTPAGQFVRGFGYDARGNITANGSQGLVFDRANRLIEVAQQAEYYYDGHGRRVADIRAGTAQRGLEGYGPQVPTRALSGPTVGQYTLYTQDGLLRGGPSAIYGARVWHIYLGSQLLATSKVNWSSGVPSVTYHHTDALGSPVVETNASRTRINRTYYAPYGEAINRSVDGPGYTGHAMDGNTGLTYMQQRYYDPVVGRFLSVDPHPVNTTTAWNFNRHAYANNSPYTFVDPDGRQSVCTGSRIAANCAPGGMFYHGPALATAAGSGVSPRGIGGVPIPSPQLFQQAGEALNALAEKATKAEEQKVYVTYTLTSADGMRTYIGRTSGYGDPGDIMMRRYATHERKLLGYHSPRLDKSESGSIGYRAIRGREQQLIDAHGGLGSPSVGNFIRGVSTINPRGPEYHAVSSALFGEIAPYSGWIGF